MPSYYTLDVVTDAAARRATLRLADGEDHPLATHEVDLGAHPPACWTAAFETPRTARTASPEEQLAGLGRFLGEHVLGAAISRRLAYDMKERVLLVRVPDAPHDPLATGFAHVPWDVALAPGYERTLLQRGVTMSVGLAGTEPGRSHIIIPRRDEPVRVLIVHADPPHARPLGSRVERERLREMFFAEVLPERNVEIDVLCHGVTRRRLEERIVARGGYHLLHWRGPIDLDRLDLADGPLSGAGLVALFRDAGGRIPDVAFLSAGHSGPLVPPRDWAALRAEHDEDGGAGGPALAGTALALHRAGVKQVVALRWEVGDPYARRLATRVYRHLFGDWERHPVDKAVALARAELRRDQVRGHEHDALDHASPMVLGAREVHFAPANQRSRQMDRRAPSPEPLLAGGSRDLDPPRSFVGRRAELRRLFQEWIGREAGKPVALIQGLPGLGKTSLAAETVHLGFDLFDHVLAFQARGAPLGIERLAENLVDAMRTARILLVLDNFETNLVREAGGYVCADPAWERLLGILSERLGETGSRVLLTSRHTPAALEGKALCIPLGALPVEEAKEYVQSHAVLRRLWYGDDADFALATRILDVSSGHPLVLARIADLAGLCSGPKDGLAPAGRKLLEEALDKIQGLRMLPDLFTGVKGNAEREREHAYLDDAATGVIDLLLERLTPEGRRLLWIVTRASEPVPEALVEKVCGQDPAALLGTLCASGLLAREREGAYTFHEIVAERAAAWMEKHAAERGATTGVEVSKTLAAWYGPVHERAAEAAARSINQGWAKAAGEVELLARADETYRQRANATRRDDQWRVIGVGREVAALRVDVEKGRAAEALPALEKYLVELRSWWARRQQGVCEMADDAYPSLTFTSALDAAGQASQALERWQPCLDLLGELEQVQRALGAGDHGIALTRFNRHGSLRMLGRLDEARAVLEGCVEVFRRVGDVTWEASAVAALADVSSWDCSG